MTAPPKSGIVLRLPERRYARGLDFRRRFLPPRFVFPRRSGFVEDEDGVLHPDPRSQERFPRFLITGRDEDIPSDFPARVHHRDFEDEDRSGSPVRKRARIPASSKAIQDLREARAGDAGIPPDCAVCLQDFSEEDKLRAMPCSHAFHQTCIFEWLQRNGVCPLCRYELPGRRPEDDDDEY